ncbi:MAG: recombinase family protein, partial [Abitibacteriaceae bacterium]|nr:recombinase family protein [Abditibacteriaceae bacterium]
MRSKPVVRLTGQPPDDNRKRAALYARVSTYEQTKGLYPSCESQVEELEAACGAKGWEVCEPITDEGYSAGSLNRPGLTRLRWLIETEQIDVVVCTWYDRFTRSRDFYTLDREMKNHKVEFVTLHDRADRATASGRFMETMLVAAKTYEREQTGEKVRSKMRMRAEKGMWNGGLVPFGFYLDTQTHVMYPDPDKADLVTQMFQTYVDTRSDCAVRDWLRAHRIPPLNGKSAWSPSTIRNMLRNRRYVAEIEINKRNQGIQELPEAEAYRIVKAPHDSVISRDLFDLAQAVRQEKALSSPNRVGKPHSYTKNQCGRVYPLQQILICGICGHSMTPYYVHHKAGGRRKRPSYIFSYLCAQQAKGWKRCDHRNYVLARWPESWILEQIAALA